MNKISFNKILAVALIAALPVVASAQTPVTDVAHIAATVQGHGTTAAQLTTMNAQLKSDATYLQTGYNGNGLIPLLSSINDKMGKVNAADTQNGASSDMTSRTRMYDQNMIDMKVSSTPTQEEFKRACVAITSRLSSKQGHGAARGASDAFRAARELAPIREEYFKSPGTATQKIAANARDRSKSGFCSKDDAGNGFPTCDTEGDLPNADVRSSSLTVGATTAFSDPSNGSLDARQQAAARAYIANTAPMPPIMPSPSILETEKGKTFLVMLNRFVGRAAAGGDAQANILSSHNAIPVTVNGQAEVSPMMKDWASREGVWATIFGPQMAFPKSPSERDMLRYEVFYYYTSPEYLKFVGNLATDERGQVMAARDTLKQQALTNRILLQMLQRQEDANVMLAQLLNQDMEPLTTQNLNAISSQASK